MRARILCFAVMLTGLAGTVKPAAGYVRSRTSGGIPHAWATSCVGLTVYPAVPSGLAADQISGALTSAAVAWSKSDPALAACTYLDLRVSVATATPPLPATQFDHVNNVTFQTDSWPNDTSALMVTSVFSIASTGAIVDADIEIDALDFTWVDLDVTPPDKTTRDLQNSLTHELGHLIGLDHTCTDDVNQPRPNDQYGNPIPDCEDAPFEVSESTMFPSSEPGDVSRRTLTPDDQQAVCDIYPLVSHPLSCADSGAGLGGARPSSPGTSTGSGANDSAACQVGAGAGSDLGAAAALAALTALFVLVQRRRVSRASKTDRAAPQRAG